MQSKMTEREFRTKFSQPYTGRPAIEVAADLVNHAVFCAREAGLEFAPEPVKLPERLEARRDGRVGWTEDGTSWVAWEPTEQNSAPVDPRQISDTALLRFNAYPGLRAAAETVIARIYDYLGKPPCYKHPITDILTPLEAELAKGPK